MPSYTYRATDSRNVTLPGQIEAESLADATQKLELQGLRVDTVELLRSESDAQADQAADFWAQAELALKRINSWLPALNALAAEWPQRRIASRLRKLCLKLEGCQNLDDVLRDPDTAQMLPALLQDPDTESHLESVQRWAVTAAETAETAARRYLALAYPAVLLAVAIGVLMFFAIGIIPTFKELFYEFGLSLPAPTRSVIWVSDLVTSSIPRAIVVTVLLIAGLIVAATVWRSQALTNRILGQFVGGTTDNLQAMSVLIGNFAELLNLGAHPSQALRMAGQSCGHKYYRISAGRVASEMSHRGFHPATSDTARIFPALMWQATSIGPTHTPNVEMLRRLADLTLDRTRVRSDWFASASPAIATLMVGAAVGWMILALFMPLVSMVTSLA